VFFQPFADSFHRPIVRRRFGMWPVKYPPVTKQPDQHPRPFSLSDLATQFDEQGFDVTPTDIGRDWTGKEQLHCALVLSFLV